MVAADASGRLGADLDTEMLPEQLPSPREVLTPGSPVVFPAKPRVGKVVHEIPEHQVTVGPVLSRIEHVRVPGMIDRHAGHERSLRMHDRHLQETPVERNTLIRRSQSEYRNSRLRMHELVDDGFQVKLVDAVQPLAV